MSTEPCSVEFFQKSNNLMNLLKFVKRRARFMSRSILILRFGNMCITIMSLGFSILVSCVSSFESVSCLRISKKLSLGM